VTRKRCGASLLIKRTPSFILVILLLILVILLLILVILLVILLNWLVILLIISITIIILILVTPFINANQERRYGAK
jgi:fatty acid desaturase